MSERVFILGAGASCFAGYPLGLDLWSFVREHSGHHETSDRRKQEVVTYIETIIQQVPPVEHDRANLEHLCTLMDIADHQMAPLALNVPWRQVRSKFVGMITEAFLHFEYGLRKMQDARIKHVLRCWTEYLRPGDTIITFNWDILHERALWDAQKWTLRDGYGFLDEAADKGHSPITILKLHGSANWAQNAEHQTPPVVAHKAIFFPGTHSDTGDSLAQAGWNEGRFLITPTYLKDVSTNPLLLSLWNQAADALATATEVVVIGYRLDPADALARQLIALSLLRNTTVKDIVVVAPPGSFNPWDSFTLTIGKRRKLLPVTFEDWVKAHGPAS